MGGIISSLLPADLFYQTLGFGRKQTNYILRVESNLRELKTELESLDAIRKDLWDEVVLAKQQQPGVGETHQVKSTLLKQVNNKFCSEEHGFDVVIWSVVSKEPNLKQIQENIGDRIGFRNESWKKKNFEAKAIDITNTWRHKKFVLLLDDIWETIIDLTELGVPLQNLQFGSKIVFTTRFRGKCCEMGAHKRFEVSCLADDDAWKLFRGLVGRYALDKHPEIQELAKAVASKRHRLPLALTTVGKAMASKEYPEEWRQAIDIISTSASKFKDIEEKVLPCLKFSYDSLRNDELRSCLLYCCLFPDDSEILKTDLIEYWKSEGFLDSITDWDVLHTLDRASLLEEEGDHVKIHDMIREMALWIEKENSWAPRKTEASELEKWQGYKRISLMENKIQSLPEIPTCPRLLTLLLEHNRIEQITDGFFQSLPSLRVLSLRGNDSLTELPVGIWSLVSLHHLDLSRTSLRGLPEEMKALVNLRYLNLEETSKMSRIPKQLICSLSKLQVLRMFKCRGGVLSDDAEHLMKELLCLEHLNVISLTLDCSLANVIPILFKYRKLVSITQSLEIRCFWLDPGLNAFDLASMENLEELNLMMCNFEEFQSTGDVKKVLRSGFRSLRKTDINGYEMKDLTWLAFVPQLQQLVISYCRGTEEIISGEKFSEVSEIMGEPNFFAQLESLSIFGFEELKSICWSPLTLPKLKQKLQCYNAHS